MRTKNPDQGSYLPPEYLWRTRRRDPLAKLLDQQRPASREERAPLRPAASAPVPLEATFRPMPYARRQQRPELVDAALRVSETVIHKV